MNSNTLAIKNEMTTAKEKRQVGIKAAKKQMKKLKNLKNNKSDKV
jgi:hypothetical protein